MLPDEIGDDEDLYRAVPNNPHFTKEEPDGSIRLTSALFKDSNGVSVDREGDRDEEDIIGNFKERKPGYGLAKISAGDCRESNTKPVWDPQEDNYYHSLIIRENDQLQLTRGQAKKLQRKCEQLYLPEMNN